MLAPTHSLSAFASTAEQQVAQTAYEVMRRLESQPQSVPSVSYLQNADIQARVAEEVASQLRPGQLQLPGVEEQIDIAAIVAKTAQMVVQQTIDIPRILVVPTGVVKSGFRPFALKLDSLKYQAPSDELWIQHLRTQEREVLTLGKGGIEESRMEDYVVSGLVDYDDVSYDDHADLLYDLASQVVSHFQTYLSEDDTRKVLRCFQRPIAQFIHAQMQDHYWEEATGYEVKVSKGFTELKPSAFTASATEALRDFRQPPKDKSNMAKYIFGGFEKCLYPVVKFHSDTERKLSVIVDRESSKWFKPAKGQFQIYYLANGEHLEYQPDFVAETDSTILMIEPKARNEMDAADVIAKSDAALRWCKQATDHALTCGGKPWAYLLVPHDEIADNMTLSGLQKQWGRNL
ncbi:MAG TPA: hypothetical protein VGN12_20650 [Pirellulales bacterium]|jgi:type III restriction enzyme